MLSQPKRNADVVSHTDTPWRQQGSLWSNLRQVCELLTIPAPVTADEEDTLFQHVRYKAGHRIHRIGQAFDTLYIVNSGFVKTIHIDEFGNEQVLSFPMKGDILGIDGIHKQHHASEAIALTDCDMILVPYKTFAALGRIHVELEQAMFSVMSREIVREQMMISMLSALSAEAKVARFLTNLGERFSQMGYSGRSFNLRMTRQEIGSYLGLTLETVSRTLSALNELGMISVEQREINLLDTAALKTLRRLPPAKAKIKVAEKVSALVNKNLLPQWNSELSTAMN
ncbi:helix-turn-helix domain-containing protein [Undibacterium sp. LX40W]|uniref:Helix-turn-helix domain-containing protein n=1 Tax=Undibacterium nitidum TaxID=2762298 RepID=A0A923HIV1_9BURK|nr:MULTISPECIES: helix-turn-helix domain-containing protein [Undibacterium]MBC3880204.1 helix-turn-helix domain-containing protein [Undibacterium nitidum]MBC3891060.1 helix-turn-helix domain-containing protein [Undibacterium sp. LX40W]